MWEGIHFQIELFDVQKSNEKFLKNSCDLNVILTCNFVVNLVLKSFILVALIECYLESYWSCSALI